MVSYMTSTQDGSALPSASAVRMRPPPPPLLMIGSRHNRRHSRCQSGSLALILGQGEAGHGTVGTLSCKLAHHRCGLVGRSIVHDQNLGAGVLPSATTGFSSSSSREIGLVALQSRRQALLFVIGGYHHGEKGS